jgi:hypothetical protein
MKEFKGTPGKWIADDSDVFTKSIIEGNVVCISPIDAGLHVSAEYWEANAKLITKAPEMLEMLQHLLKQGSLFPEDDTAIKNLLNEIL